MTTSSTANDGSPVAPTGPRRPHRRRHYWLPAALVAIAVHVSAFFLLGVTVREPQPRNPAARGIRWVGERGDTDIDVRDPKAIFLPTRHNAGSIRETGVESVDRGSGDIFGFAEKPVIVPPGQSPAGLVEMPQGPGTAGVAIRRFTRPTVSALGQVDVPLVRLPPRVALLDVRGATSGEFVMRRELLAADLEGLGVDASRWPLWKPFEMLLAVEATGTLGPPLVLAPGAEVEEVDAFFRTHLRAILRPDLILPGGYYRLVVGP